MFIIVWAGEAFLHACTHAITWRVTTNSVMASAAAPLEQQIDIIGAQLGYRPLLPIHPAKIPLLLCQLAMAKALFMAVCRLFLIPFVDWCLALA